ncbi:MAG: SsrA-binding protein SmpB [Chloroflexi bacterium]|nr:SsrA-binding protein SmpB [Chloroflexota bacterium]
MPPKRKKKPAKAAAPGAERQPYFRTVADNRRARFDYDLMERIEAGLALTGTEIKSVRAGQANIRDAYAQIRDGEMWLQNMHVAPWAGGGPWNHEPMRPRRLLLNRREIDRFHRQVLQKGLTIVPLRLYIKGHYAKVEVALAKGRRRYDKRQAIMRRETEREIGRAMRRDA